MARKNLPILDKSEKLTEKDEAVISAFINGMHRRDAYRSVYVGQRLSDSSIYNWFKLDKVVTRLKEYEMQLDNYNVVCDKVLINVITGDETSNRDKISAIKLWADLRNRITTKIKIEQEKTVSFEDVTDENLEAIIKAIQDGSK